MTPPENTYVFAEGAGLTENDRVCPTMRPRLVYASSGKGWRREGGVVSVEDDSRSFMFDVRDQSTPPHAHASDDEIAAFMRGLGWNVTNW